MSDRGAVRAFYDSRVEETERRRARRAYYHALVRGIVAAAAPEAKSVLLLGCGTGETLSELAPARGVGVDVSPAMVARAAAKHPRYDFVAADAEALDIDEAFDLIVAENLVGEAEDLWALLRNARRQAHERTRLVIIFYNRLWEPLIALARLLGLQMRRPVQNWIPLPDLENLLDVTGWEPIRSGHRCLLPVRIPLLSDAVNRWVAPLPLFRRLGLVSFLTARLQPRAPAPRDEHTVTVVVPCLGDPAALGDLVRRVPRMGRHTNVLVAVDPARGDALAAARAAAAALKGERDVDVLEAGGARRKRDLLWSAFEAARGDVLMTLDADASVAPEDLPKFYCALSEGRCDFVNGSRLVYAMDEDAMRPLDLLANHGFARAFSFVLSARIRDTLCGTKAFFRRDWPAVRERARESTDPLGDFDLLLGAAALGLKIGEIPVRYRERSREAPLLRRVRHASLLAGRLLRGARESLFAPTPPEGPTARGRES